MGTLNGVPYVEVNPGEEAVVGFDGVNKPRAFLIAWNDVDDFITGLLGGISYVRGLHATVRGMAYESGSSYRARTTRIRGVGKPFKGSNGFIAYPQARVQVSFGIPQIENSEDAGGETWANTIEEEMHVEFLTVPGKYLKYNDGADKPLKSNTASVPYQVGTLTITRKNWNVPGLAASNVTIAQHFEPYWGKTNSSSFMGQPVGTVILGGYRVTPQGSYDESQFEFAFGVRVAYDLTVTLLIKKPGWNCLFIPGNDDNPTKHPGWQTVYINEAGSKKPFPETSFRSL